MKIGSISNETIKILFSPDREELLLGDLVKITNDEDKGVLGQVFKIENSKKDNERNVAYSKSLLTIKGFNQWKTWEGNVPSLEYNVEKITGKELLHYISSLKPVNPISLGTASLYRNERIKIPAAKFEKPTVIISDKTHQKINLAYILAQELSKNRAKAVILDFDGSYSHITTANRIEAGKNFKLPLDSKGIEGIFEKGLSAASLETRAVLEEIFSDIQEYITENKLEFIPFAHFKNVVDEEYQQNQAPELALLKNRLIKLDKQGIFAHNKLETESFMMYNSKFDFIIVDLSHIPACWQKDFLEYIVNSNIELCNQRYFLIFEGNKENLDNDLINKLYIYGYRSGIKPIILTNYCSELNSKLLSMNKNLILFSPDIYSAKIQDFESFLTRLNNEEALIYGEISSNIPLIVKIDKSSSEYEFSENNKIFDDSFMDNASAEDTPAEESYDMYQDDDTDDYTYTSTYDKYEETTQIPEETEEVLEDSSPDYQEEEFSYEDDETGDSFYSSLAEDKNIPYEENTENEDAENTEESSYSDEGFFDFSQEDLEEQDVKRYEEDAYQLEESLFKEEPLDFSEEPLEERESLNTYDEEKTDETEQYDFLKEESYQYNSTPEYESVETNIKIPSPDIPIYPSPDIDKSEEEQIDFKEGDVVRHEKYGVGTIQKIITYGNKKLCSIQFKNLGRRLLDPTLAVLEKV